MLIVHYFHHPVNVVGYDPLNGTITLNCRTFLSAVAYDCPMTGEVFIIEVNQEILIDHLHSDLFCLMQMRMYYVKVNDTTEYLTDNPTYYTHSIVMHEKGETPLIPLHLHGVTSYLPPGSQP